MQQVVFKGFEGGDVKEKECKRQTKQKKLKWIQLITMIKKIEVTKKVYF